MKLRGGSCGCWTRRLVDTPRGVLPAGDLLGPHLRIFPRWSPKRTQAINAVSFIAGSIIFESSAQTAFYAARAPPP
jgi:hypothetical protein